MDIRSHVLSSTFLKTAFISLYNVLGNEMTDMDHMLRDGV